MQQRLKLKALDEKEIEGIISIAKEVLEKEGIEIESELVKKLLYDNNVKIEKKPGRKYDVALISPDIVDRCLQTVPKCIKMHDRNGNLVAVLEGDNTYFNPGSCATNYYDYRTNTHRKPTEKDLIEFTRIADYLEYIHMVSTAMNVSEADPKIQDAYRLYVVLQNSAKPIVTGTFSDNFELMKDMLVVIRGSEDELRAKPLAIFDCCPSPALKWAKTWSEDLIRCGKYGIPAEFISMPQPGLSAPITLYDSLVQHTAETFSGIVISQLANPGAPLIYGGSPTMGLNGIALLGDIGTAKIDLAYTAIAKSLGLPCQAYLGLSDSKTIDVQAGFEKGITLMLATLAGINNVSGPGMLESENCQSKEMLIIDNEFCGAALYFVQGVKKRETSAVEDITIMAREAMVNPDNIRYVRSDEFYHAELADKDNLASWKKNGRKRMLENAIKKADHILATYEPEPLDEDKKKDLDSCLY